MLKGSLVRERKNAENILTEAVNAKEFLKSYLISELVNEAFRKIDWRTSATNRERL